MIDLDCVILCGGKSSRMGQNKAFLDFNGVPLIQVLIEKYQKIFTKLHICHKATQDFMHLPCSHILEDSPIFAPLFGIEASLKTLQNPICFTCVDYPYLQPHHFQFLLESHQTHHTQITYATTPQKSHFLIGIYSPSVLNKVNQQIKSYNFKISLLIHSCTQQQVLFQEEENFYNLNTPEDYQQALNHLKGQ